MIIEGDWSATSGKEALISLVAHDRAPTAIFAQNDRMAMGILRAARDRDIKVPSQLAVIGVDDMPLSSYFDPPLTTMRQDMPLIGQQATRILLDMIQNENTSRRALKFPAQLIVRQSTLEGGA
jgi:LacI family repressor for deo operon, udp, cdd, tsx, nupC, and nupG